MRSFKFLFLVLMSLAFISKPLFLKAQDTKQITNSLQFFLHLQENLEELGSKLKTYSENPTEAITLKFNEFTIINILMIPEFSYEFAREAIIFDEQKLHEELKKGKSKSYRRRVGSRLGSLRRGMKVVVREPVSFYFGFLIPDFKYRDILPQFYLQKKIDDSTEEELLRYGGIGYNDGDAVFRAKFKCMINFCEALSKLNSEAIYDLGKEQRAMLESFLNDFLGIEKTIEILTAIEKRKKEEFSLEYKGTFPLSCKTSNLSQKSLLTTLIQVMVPILKICGSCVHTKQAVGPISIKWSLF